MLHKRMKNLVYIPSFVEIQLTALPYCFHLMKDLVTDELQVMKPSLFICHHVITVFIMHSNEILPYTSFSV